MHPDITIDQIIGFFKDIPEDNWGMASYAECMRNPNLKPCALTHIYLKTQSNDMVVTIQRLTIDAGMKYEGMAHINDGRITRYTQDTPKKRVMAYLSDIKIGLTP